MLLGLVFDPSWIYIGKRKLWIPAAIVSIRFGLAALLTSVGAQPVMALAISYLSSSLFFLSISGIRANDLDNIRTSIFIRILKRYYTPTLTEGVTAVFSRLDIAIAALLLQPSEALIYAVSRKLMLGINSVLFSSARIFYLERDANHLYVLQRRLTQYTWLAFVFSLPVSIFFIKFWFNLQIDFELIVTLLSLSMLILLGHKKILMQFGFFYVNQKFSMDLIYSVVSLLSFLSLLVILTFFDLNTAFTFSIARLMPDFLYVFLAKYGKR
jgi:hypothetical protein